MNNSQSKNRKIKNNSGNSTHSYLNGSIHDTDKKQSNGLSLIFETVLNDDYATFKKLVSYEQCDLNQTGIFNEKKYILIEFVFNQNREEMLKLLLDVDRKRIHISNSLLYRMGTVSMKVMLLNDDRINPQHEKTTHTRLLRIINMFGGHPYIINILCGTYHKIINSALTNPNFNINFIYGTKKESLLMYFIRVYDPDKNFESMKLLLRNKKLNINYRDIDGNTALHYHIEKDMSYTKHLKSLNYLPILKD